MKLSQSVAFVILYLYSPVAWSQQQSFEVIAPRTGVGYLRYNLPYTVGNHEGESKEIAGQVQMDSVAGGPASGTLRIPIQSILSSSKERDCHMIEALSLDYSKSQYPREHVCDEEDQLPGQPIAYPYVEFSLEAVKRADEKIIAVDGEWRIHGVARPVRIPIEFSLDADGFRIKGKAPISLKSHEVVVKSAKVLFVTISVEDQLTVEFDLRFKRVAKQP